MGDNTDITDIISGVKGNTRYDFAGLGDPVKSFFDASKQRDEFDKRRAFREGVPTDADGNPDFSAISKTFFQKGNFEQGINAANLDLQRQQLKFGQQQSAAIGAFEQGGNPQPIVSPPSPNRSASVPVAPPLANRGGVGSPQGDQPGSIVGLVSDAGIPNDAAGPVIAQIAGSLKIDPNATVSPNLVPRVQQALQAYKARTAAPQQPPQAAAPPAAMPPQAAPGPVTNPVTTQNAPQVPSRVDRAIAYYAGIMSNPMSPKNNIELAKTRLEALQKSAELTPEQKAYAQAVTQGFTGTMQEYQAKVEADKTYAAENVKSYIKKYDQIQTAGDRARTDIPQLDLARRLTENPDFYSGVGEKYNLLVKRALVALGGDPNTAAPQEAFRKIVSNSILDQIKGMAGTGQIRVAEIKIMEQAAANPENTPQSNRLLLELASRLQKRSVAISDMAQKYNNGRLDSGFDREVAAYDRKNPIISDKEIPDFRKIIGGPKAAQQKFATPADVHAAVAAGKLKRGDAFQDEYGKTRYVP